MLVWVSGCAISSAERLQRIADARHFFHRVERAGGFSHVVYLNGLKANEEKSLHVYLEGDGTPWQFRYFVSPDPTPRYPLMLELMANDTEFSIYVGRPCYNGFNNEANCAPALWTIARHSPIIVSSMAQVISRISDEMGIETLHLYGHSGGGAMAMLIAKHLNNVDTVITLAGNLDLKAWTDLHGYTPLYGSANPATQKPLNSSIKQLHLMARNDKKIPPELVLEWIKKQKNSRYFIFDEFSHSCCWDKIWPTILNYASGYQSQSTSDLVFTGEGTLSEFFTSH